MFAENTCTKITKGITSFRLVPNKISNPSSVVAIRALCVSNPTSTLHQLIHHYYTLVLSSDKIIYQSFILATLWK